MSAPRFMCGDVVTHTETGAEYVVESVNGKRDVGSWGALGRPSRRFVTPFEYWYEVRDTATQQRPGEVHETQLQHAATSLAGVLGE